MCHEPCSIMCVRSVRPFSKRTSRFLPRAVTSSMRSPTGARARLPWKRVTRAPTSALRSAVAARKTVSPSGIFLLERLHRLCGRRFATQRGALQVAPDAGGETHFLQRRRERRAVHVLAVDAGDQQRLAPAIFDERSECLRERAREARPVRLFGGQIGVQVLLASPEPADEDAIV